MFVFITIILFKKNVNKKMLFYHFLFSMIKYAIHF